MDKKTQKLENFVNKYLNKTREEILNQWGKPEKYSENDVLLYSQYSYIIFKDEIAFIMENDRVVDIMITECVFWIAVRNMFYFKDKNPKYKVYKLF